MVETGDGGGGGLGCILGHRREGQGLKLNGCGLGQFVVLQKCDSSGFANTLYINESMFVCMIGVSYEL